MKTFLRLMLPSLVVVMLMSGCAKQPTQEINDAKAAVDAVMAEGADKYAAEDAKLLKETLGSAMDEIKVQDGKFMKNYGKAKELLGKVKTSAETLKKDLPAKKEQAKVTATQAVEAAKTAVAEATGLLAKAPKGKGSSADIEAMKADVKGLDDMLAEAQKLLASEDYSGAANSANKVKEKAAAVSDQIKQALDKVKGKK